MEGHGGMKLFDINKEFRYKKDEIISLYVTDDFEIKKNDYKI